MHLENYKSFYIIKNSYITCLNIIIENNIIIILLLFFCYIFHYLLTFFLIFFNEFLVHLWDLNLNFLLYILNISSNKSIKAFEIHFFFYTSIFSSSSFFFFLFFFLHFLYHISFLVDIYNEKYINKRNYLKYKLQYEKNQINFKL